MTVLERELGGGHSGISLDNKKITINGEEGEYTAMDTCDYITTPTKKYIIENIAHLLQQNIETDHTAAAAAISEIRESDKILLHHILKKSELLGPGKPYQLHNGQVRYSSGDMESPKIDENGRKNIRPSATFITSDIDGFQPITKNFSKDNTYVYYQHYRIGEKLSPDKRPNQAKFQSLKDSNYGSDGDTVFYMSTPVEDAMVGDTHYTIVQNDTIELLTDSRGQIFVGSKKLHIEHTERCGHIVDNFLFDGENVYMVLGFVAYNLTRRYELTPGATITKGENGVYTIGDRSFVFDVLMNIKRIKKNSSI